MKNILPLIIFILLSNNCIAQNPPEEFIKGLDIFQKSPEKAKKLFHQAISKDSAFSGSYNFLGIIFQTEKQYDSAIYYLEKAVLLNTENVNHTKEMSIVRLSRTYLYTGNFKKAYETSSAGFKEFPESNQILQELKDVCAWAFNIKFNGLDSTYLLPDKLKSYTVNNIAQEYLILRNIVIEGNHLMMLSQGFDSKKKADILNCIVKKTNEKVELTFKINWDMDKDFGGKQADIDALLLRTDLTIWERLAAMHIKNPQLNFAETIKLLEEGK